jgi:hypothetical protein
MNSNYGEKRATALKIIKEAIPQVSSTQPPLTGDALEQRAEAILTKIESSFSKSQ